MSELHFHPDHARALARDLRESALLTDLGDRLSATTAPTSPATAELLSALTAASVAVERRSALVAARLASLVDDAESFIAGATTLDHGLAQRWEEVAL